MEKPKPRRKFMGMLGVSLSGAMLALTGRRAVAGGVVDEPTKGKPYSGTSKSGDLGEALEAAIKSALASTNVSDAQAKWTLKEVCGIKGGMLGRNELTVIIDAVVP